MYSSFLNYILSEIPDPSNKKIQNIMLPEKSPFKFKTALPIGSVDYRDLSLPDQNSLTYVCGNLMMPHKDFYNYMLTILIVVK